MGMTGQAGNGTNRVAGAVTVAIPAAATTQTRRHRVAIPPGDYARDEKRCAEAEEQQAT
jgi:hypothetical protein